MECAIRFFKQVKTAQVSEKRGREKLRQRAEEVAELISSTFFKRKREEEAGLLNLDGHLMFRQGADGCFEGVKLEGRNAGATTIARQGRCGDCCSINIYISNNVQGVNNSILVGSDVKQGNAGVCLSLKGLKLDRGFQKSSKKKTSELAQGLGWIILVALLAVILFCSIM